MSFRRQSLAHLLFGALLLAFPEIASAQADDDYANPDRPGIADGSEVIGAKRFQIETGLQIELRNEDGSKDRTIFLPTLFRVGLSDKFEVRVESNGYNWERSRDQGEDATQSRGWSPVSIGAKYQIQKRDGARQPAIGVIGRLFPPSGSGDFRSDHWIGDLRLAADWDFAPKLSLNPNVGVGHYEDDHGRAFNTGLLAVTLNYNPSKQLNFFVDTGEQFPEQRNGHASAIVDAGVAYLPTKNLQLDLSVGTRVAGVIGPHPFFSAGISRRF